MMEPVDQTDYMSVTMEGSTEPFVVFVGSGTEALPTTRRVCMDPTDLGTFTQEAWRKVCAAEGAELPQMALLPTTDLDWAYTDGEPWDPQDTDDVRTLAVFAGCEMLAGRPSPCLRCKHKSQDWVPMVNSALVANDLHGSRASLDAIGDGDATVLSDRRRSEHGVDTLDGPAPSGMWARYQRLITPPTWIDEMDVSDCVPFYPRSYLINRVLEALSLIIILVSVATFCLETLPQYRLDKHGKELEQAPLEFFVIETVCVGWFTIELSWRLFFAPSKWAFAKSPLNIIDLIAILPYYISLGMDSKTGSELTIVRILRLSRVSRLAKVGRHSSRLQDMITCIGSTSSELVLFFLITSVATILFGSAIFYAEKDQRDTDFISIPASLWWALITMTTVGYGDMVPETIAGKLIGGLCASIGVVLLAIPAGIFISEFMRIHEDRKREKSTGEGALNVRLEFLLRDAIEVVDGMLELEGHEIEKSNGKLVQEESDRSAKARAAEVAAQREVMSQDVSPTLLTEQPRFSQQFGFDGDTDGHLDADEITNTS